MRVNLAVPYAEKDEAKRLGARWDAARRVWYVQDVENLWPFMRWMPQHAQEPPKDKPKDRPKKPRRDRSFHGRTGPAQAVPHCGCDVLPWEDCEHTEPPLEAEAARHLASI